MDLSTTFAGTDAPINRRLFRGIARAMWEHQQHLIEHPDPTDEWWFLVDPTATPPLP